MTKIDPTATFVGDEITEVKLPKPPSRVERLNAWKKENYPAYKRACDGENCTCTPSRADMLLIQQFEGNGPADL